MAERPVPDSENPTRRYADLEKAYIEERWLHVLHGGEALLDALRGEGDPQSLALLNRVRLLIGHTALYGLGESQVAEDHYRAVLHATQESDLRRIASEGLERCQEARTATASGSVAEAAGPEARPVSAAESSAAAGLGPATPPESAQPAESGAGNATRAGLRPEPAATTPIATEPAGAGAPAPWLSDSASGSAPLPLPTDPFQAALAAAGASAGAAPADQAALPDLARAVTLEPAMPWLQAPASRPGPQPLAPQGPPAAGADGPGPLAPRLEVEVVEEPELVEVAQADPLLAEELELELSRIRARRAASVEKPETPQPPAPRAEPSGMAAATADPKGERGGGLGMATPPQTVGEELAAAPPQDRGEAKHSPAPELAAAAGMVPIVAAELAATTAVPLSREDPDLVAGLLGVSLRS